VAGFGTVSWKTQGGNLLWIEGLRRVDLIWLFVVLALPYPQRPEAKEDINC
jgi:hypothetical protein